MALNDTVLFVGGIAIPAILLSTIALYVVLAIFIGLFGYYLYQKHKPCPEEKLLEDIRHHKI